MKKIVTALALVATLGFAFTATNASAWGHGYGHGGYGHGGYGMMNGYGHGGYGMGPGMMYGNAPVDGGAYQKFLDDTAEVRTSLAADQAELNAVMRSDNPDSARVRTLTETIIQKQAKLSAAAREHNVAPLGRGYGRGLYCNGMGNW